MNEGCVDLRSDTVTRPGPEMRAAMAAAEVGDDVYREDPTVEALEVEAAARIGHEAALFVPSGTMGNQIAIHLLAPRGSEAIVEAGSHVYNYELGAMAAWSGVLPRVLRGSRGCLDPDEVRETGRPRAYYDSRVTLLLVENTHNHAGGTVLRPEAAAALLAAARDRGLAAHLDGARIWNAAAALGVPAASLAEGFDTVMFCLSKGLGAPVGSLLCGSRARIEEARVVRKRMGGGMRQAGVLAAAGLVALRANTARLVDDYVRARRLAEVLEATPTLRIRSEDVETNIVIAEADPPSLDAEWIGALRERGVLAGGMGHGRIRFVTHLDVDDAGLERAADAIGAVGRLLAARI